MATSFRDVFKEINTLVSQGEINIHGEKIELEFFLGNDYKVIKANSIIFYFMIYKIICFYFFSSCCQYLA